MFVIDDILIGAAVLSAGAGLFESISGKSKQTDIAKQQAMLSAQQAQASAQFSEQQGNINIASAQASADAASSSAAINQQIIGFNNQIQGQRKQAMELDARRSQLEEIRKLQRARAVSLQVGIASGSQRGSGLQGAYAQQSGQSGNNMLGIQQNLGIGENIFALNSNISQQNIAMEQLKSQYAKQQADFQTQQSQLATKYAYSNANFQTRQAQLGGQMASAQGQSALGSSLMQASSSFLQAGQLSAKLAPSFGNIFGPSPIASSTSFDGSGGLGGLY
jgi:hypothetical protein